MGSSALLLEVHEKKDSRLGPGCAHGCVPKTKGDSKDLISIRVFYR